MIKINENFTKFESSYLFSDISDKVGAFSKKNPKLEIISLGIGDVTRALPQVCINAFHKAVEEMSMDHSFRGYGPVQGFEFLREKIAYHDYQSRGIDISLDEIFVSDGSKCDVANFQEIFDKDTSVAIPDPVYPVYLDTNIMAGRAGYRQKSDGRYDGITYLESRIENNFVPPLPTKPVDLIYLCFPNNPTGAVISKKDLRNWVRFARENNSIILYDAAYEAFTKDKSLPRSIYEIEGAKKVAIEFKSFSKNAGFTGIRCAYVVVPKNCLAYAKKGEPYSVNDLWKRRQSTKFNGVSYPVQRAAEATYSDEGLKQVRELVKYYMLNAKLISNTFRDLNFPFSGGINSPYIWVSVDLDSWSFFRLLLEKAGVVCTPGIGFGKCGSNFVRISSFNSHNKVKLAMDRIMCVLNEQATT